MARPKGTPKTGGRVAGRPNKTTQEVREAVALLAQNNVSKLEQWLEDTANGNPDQGVKPAPEKAAMLLLQALEYYIPKLARTELSGPDGGPIEISSKEQRDAAVAAAIRAND